MAETKLNHMTRAVFSDIARVAFQKADQPLHACDPATGVELSYRHEPHVGGTLRLSGGPLGQRTIALGCDEDDLELVAGLLLDGIAVRLAAGPRVVARDPQPKR